MTPVQKPPASSEVTPEALYLRRREMLKSLALFGITAAGVGGGLVGLSGGARRPAPESPVPATPTPASGAPPDPLVIRADPRFDTTEAQTPFGDVTSYNNFYEFGTSKEAPARNAGRLTLRPWTLTFDGELARPATIDIDTLLRWFPLQERIYRMRCVEAWSMVIPWFGFPLGELLKRLEPTSRARYVAFETLLRPSEMPGQRGSVLDWPYVEGLRIDEAMHPLTMLAAGLYGRTLPAQNGAPLRLVVPWKYGFKGIKSIVRIRLVEQMPATTWNRAAPDEYGFFANVNPEVDHPRWSQATERRIGDLARRPTLPFNGYAEQVAGLYAGMDLRANF